MSRLSHKSSWRRQVGPRPTSPVEASDTVSVDVDPDHPESGTSRHAGNRRDDYAPGPVPDYGMAFNGIPPSQPPLGFGQVIQIGEEGVDALGQACGQGLATGQSRPVDEQQG